MDPEEFRLRSKNEDHYDKHADITFNSSKLLYFMP